MESTMTVEEITEQILLVTQSRLERELPHSIFMALIQAAYAIQDRAGVKSLKVQIRYPTPGRAHK